MPRREASFTVNAPPEELWRFMRDFHSLCTCIPGVERIDVVDDRTAELTVREKIGVVPLIVDLRARIDAEDPPYSLRAVAKAEFLTIKIDVTLQATGSGTALRAVFDVAGEGQLKPIVDRLFERRATERTAQFAACLQKRFGADASNEAPEESRVLEPPAQNPIAQLRRWLGARWRRLLGRSPASGK